MFKRLKTLVAMQFNNKINFPRDLRGIITYVILRLMLIAAVFAVAYLIFWFFRYLVILSVDMRFLLCSVGILEAIAIVGNTSLLNRELYFARDNTILFSLPVRHDEVFLSKLIVFYIDDFIKNFYLLLPVIAAYGVFNKTVSPVFISGAALLVILLPLFSVLLGAILSIGIIYLHRFLKKYSLANLIFFLAIAATVFSFILYLLSLLPAEVRILSQFSSFIKWIYNVMGVFAGYLYVLKNMTNMLTLSVSTLDYAIVFGVLVILIVLTAFLARPLYFKVTSHMSESVGTKCIVSYNRERGKFAAFFAKEVKLLVRDSGRFTGYVVSLVSFPMLLYVINRLFSTQSTSAVGDSLIAVFNMVVGIMLITAANSGMAASVTVEGLEFSVLKAAPGSTQKIAWAKLLLNLICSAIAIIIGYTVAWLTTKMAFDTAAKLVTILIPVSFAHILWSFQFDILKPYFNEYIITGNMSNNKNVGKSVFLGLGLALAFPAAALFFFLDKSVTTSGVWLRLMIGAAIFLIFRFALFTVNLKVYFKRIEL